MIAIVAAATGVLIALVGVIGIANPAWLKRFAQTWTTGPRLHLISAFRFALAVVYWLAAPDSRYPIVLQVLAGLTLIAGVVAVAMPARMVARMAGWFISIPDVSVRVWCVFPIAFGAFIVYVTL